MPAYVLRCDACDESFPEVNKTMKARESMVCHRCNGPLENDYARHRTASFSLKGDNWPGKTISTENAMRKLGEG